MIGRAAGPLFCSFRISGVARMAPIGPAYLAPNCACALDRRGCTGQVLELKISRASRFVTTDYAEEEQTRGTIRHDGGRQLHPSAPLLGREFDSDSPDGAEDDSLAIRSLHAWACAGPPRLASAFCRASAVKKLVERFRLLALAARCSHFSESSGERVEAFSWPSFCSPRVFEHVFLA